MDGVAQKKIKQAYVVALTAFRNTGVLPRTACSKGNNTIVKAKGLATTKYSAILQDRG